jgi:hypothetical protein
VNFPQITHLDVQVYSGTVPVLESKITMSIKLYLKYKYKTSHRVALREACLESGLGMPISAFGGDS